MLGNAETRSSRAWAKMKATLVHNPDAGAGDISQEELVRTLEVAGFELTYQSSKIGELTAALSEPGDIIIVAGGDGTVGKVLTQMPDRNVPVGILPLGTANNIASSLGIGGPLARIAANLRIAERRRFDIAQATGPWGCCWVVEGVGLGALVRLAEEANSHGALGDDPLKVARSMLRKVLKKSKPDNVCVMIDGKAVPSEHLMLEVLNIACGGPRLLLSPDVDSGDGELDVLWLEPERRDAMREWLEQDEPTGRPPLTHRRGRRVTIEWDGTPLHVDDDIPSPEQGVGRIEVELAPEAATILVPAVDGPPGEVE
jgi:diacylglycerol kinase (ATP)